MKKYTSVVILADGRFPQHSEPLKALDTADFIVCCDGATKKLLDWGRNPNVIVGDLDSLPIDLQERFKDIIYPSDDQETNDLTKAVEWCISYGIKEVSIIGATGLRDDHTLGNISLLVDYAENINVKMISDSGVFIPILKTTMFDCVKGQQISIFCITPNTEVTTHGLKYAVYKRRFTNWWQGSLNEAEGEQFKIEFKSGRLIIFKAFT